MNELLIISGLALFWMGVMIAEYRNPLWTEIVSCGDPIPKTTDEKTSVQMVFFWRSAPTYRKAQKADYWNSMEVTCLKEGIVIKRPTFLFGRKPVFLPWSKLELGKTFRAWFSQRRSICIKGTDLYLSISEKTFRQGAGSNVLAKS